MPGSPARVRFAPSPTGYFHVGSARTALFNWVVARQTGGTFILRIEDTDADRSREEWVDGILSALHWLGMDADEGPIRQSSLAERYRQAEDALWEGGYLYACDCTHEEIEARNKAAGRLTPGYDGFCRERKLPRGEGRALRFRSPDEGVTTVADVVRGDVVFPNDAIDDFVVVKGNGAPLFVLANVVDDIDMAISHVIRGEDLLPTTPKGILLWQALAAVGWEARRTDGAMAGDAAGDGGSGQGAVRPVPPLPVFAHLPMLVNEQRKKLSKRRDPVAVEDYRDQGYLADAFVNYLGLLGWGPPDGEEIFDRDKMLHWFTLEDVNHAPAFFDVVKLTHMNGEYIRAMPVDDFIEAARPWLTGGAAPWPDDRFDEATFRAIAPLVQERVATLGEVPAMVDFLFLEAPAVDEPSFEKAVVEDESGPVILARAAASYRALDTWERDALYQATAAVGDSVGRKLGKAQAPIRVAVTGRRVGPPLFESLALLGREPTLARIEAALGRAGHPAS
ncbi:MAG: glutamate--tRNA ligase family protein [Acidimicrobiales bacterium]